MKSLLRWVKIFHTRVNKSKSGHYVVLVFNIDGSQIDTFKARLKLSTDVFRYQFTVITDANVVTEVE